MIVRELLAKFGIEFDGKESVEKVSHAVHLFHDALENVEKVAHYVKEAYEGLIGGNVELASQTSKAAEKIGISAQEYQKLEYAAYQADVGTDTLNTGLKLLAKNAVAAAEGSDEMTEAFAGIQLRDQNHHLKTSSELLLDVAEKFEKTENPTERMALALKLFGRSGADMIPLLKLGRKGVAAYGAEIEKLGGIMSNDFLEKAERVEEGQKRMNTIWRAFKIDITDQAMPALQRVLDGTYEWWMRNRDVVHSGLDSFTGLLSHNWDTLSGAIKDGYTNLYQWMEYLLGSEGAARGAIGGMGLAMLALKNPIAGVSVAIGLMIDDFQVWKDGGQSIIGDFQKDFENLDESAGMFVDTLGMILRFLEIIKEGGGLKEIWQETKDTLSTAADYYGINKGSVGNALAGAATAIPGVGALGAAAQGAYGFYQASQAPDSSSYAMSYAPKVEININGANGDAAALADAAAAKTRAALEAERRAARGQLLGAAKPVGASRAAQ
jgi:hypothetical protein